MQWGEFHEGNYRWLQGAGGHTTGRSAAARLPAPFVSGYLAPRGERVRPRVSSVAAREGNANHLLAGLRPAGGMSRHDNHCTLFRGCSPCGAVVVVVPVIVLAQSGQGWCFLLLRFSSWNISDGALLARDPGCFGFERPR